MNWYWIFPVALIVAILIVAYVLAIESGKAIRHGDKIWRKKNEKNDCSNNNCGFPFDDSDDVLR